MKKITVFFIFLLILENLFSQSVVKEELFKVNRESVEFVNYEGPHQKIETADEIRGIGTFLGERIKGGAERGSYHNRYSIIHAVSGNGEGLLNADIFIIEKDAVVDHINNVRRIISGYLQAAYEYNRDDADILAEFATYYNAVYRGNFQYFISSYNQIVIDSLEPEKTGISTRYTDWPGNTQMIIPLTASGQMKVATDTVSVTEVIEDLRSQEDKGIEPRKDMVELKERELEEDQSVIDQQKEKLKEEETSLEEEKAALETTKDEISESDVNEAEKEISRKEAEIEVKKDEIEQKEVVQKERQEAVQAERELIAQDEKKLIETRQPGIAEALATPDRVPFLLIDPSDPDLMGRLVLISADTGEVYKRSSVNTVRGRRYYFSGKNLVIVSGIDKSPQAVRLMTLDPVSLEILSQGNDDVFSETAVLINGESIFALTRTEGKWYVGRFNGELILQVRSDLEVIPYSPLQLNRDILLVQLKDGKISRMDSNTLKVVE